MARTFKWRLTISYLILILFFLCVVGVTVTRSVDKFYMDNLRHHLMYESRLVAELVLDYDFVQPSSEMAGAAVRASHDTEARITIIAADGTVLADSQKTFLPWPITGIGLKLLPPQGDNYSVIRYSSTLRTNMMYVAVPWFRRAKRGGEDFSAADGYQVAHPSAMVGNFSGYDPGRTAGNGFKSKVCQHFDQTHIRHDRGGSFTGRREFEKPSFIQ